MTFCETQNHTNNKRISGCQELKGREEWLGKVWRIFRVVKLLWMLLQWWIRVTMHLSKPTECTIPTVNPNVNHGIWVTIVNVSSSIITHFPFWWRMWKMKSLCILGTGSIWKMFVVSAPFYWEPNAARRKNTVKMCRIRINVPD